MLESEFQADLILEIEERIPNCIVLKNDPNYIQGFPDLLILYGKKWAALEVKRTKNSFSQPNQKYYISLLDRMGYASFIYPENKEAVLNELQQALRPYRSARILKRE